MTRSKSQANALVNESSPYLLQHAYNPVDWYPYSPGVFERARREDKPLLISIGYSACHWCHVMEHESFEDPEVAALMNAGFVNVKVDREEHSDVDMHYMQAVQLMTGQGGWPLNCFVLPDGRAFYGGTYFPKAQWLRILHTLSDLYATDRAKVENYATALNEGMQQAEELLTSPEKPYDLRRDELMSAVEKWKSGLDYDEGGPNRAPKFPMPVNYLFLLRYAKLSGDENIRQQVWLTLNKMACGGLYDQLRGGFARYSTDMNWKVPHFEKMLYDNAQLISLYTEAYLESGNELYKSLVYQSLDFVSKEWTGREGNFYSAFDADSEGEEGKYYVWTEEELQETLGKDYVLFKDLYEVNERGYWEKDHYILMRTENLAGILVKFGLKAEELEQIRTTSLEKLRQRAETRVKPGLDDKSICSWNAMMCSAYARAALAFGEERFREAARRNMAFLLGKMRNPEGDLLRAYKSGQARIGAFLEDYAFVIEALLSLYALEGDETLLHEAKTLTEHALQRFKNEHSPLLYYRTGDSVLPGRPTEVSDNVIPASNSQMALNLFYLSRYFAIPEWEELALRMLDCVSAEFMRYPPAYANWGNLALHRLYPFYELALVGKDVNEKAKDLANAGLTNTILALSTGPSSLPLLKGRYMEGKTLIYVCRNRSCQLPVEKVNEALKQLEQS